MPCLILKSDRAPSASHLWPCEWEHDQLGVWGMRTFLMLGRKVGSPLWLAGGAVDGHTLVLRAVPGVRLLVRQKPYVWLPLLLQKKASEEELRYLH